MAYETEKSIFSYFGYSVKGNGKYNLVDISEEYF